MDEGFFTERVQALEARLYRVAYALLWNDADCADALQEAIRRAWQKRNSLRDEARFDAWLTRILINECQSMRRRMKNKPLPLEEGALADQAAPVRDGALRDALRLLPEHNRLPLLLHHLDGLPVADIARMLRLPVTTVKFRLYQGRQKLKAILKEDAE